MQPTISDLLISLPVLVLIIAVIAIILILVSLKYYQFSRASPKKKSPAQKKRVSPGPAASSASTPGATMPVGMPELTDKGTIQGNVASLAEKYRLSEVTLATYDGLMITSTQDHGRESAARFTELWKTGAGNPEKGVYLFEIEHKGSPVIGIIRSDNPVHNMTLQDIENDTRKILQWWI